MALIQPTPPQDSMRSLQSQVPSRLSGLTGQPIPQPRLAQPRPQVEQQTQAPAPAKKWYTNKILWASLLSGSAVAGTGYLTLF